MANFSNALRPVDDKFARGTPKSGNASDLFTSVILDPDSYIGTNLTHTLSSSFTIYAMRYLSTPLLFLLGNLFVTFMSASAQDTT